MAASVARKTAQAWSYPGWHRCRSRTAAIVLQAGGYNGDLSPQEVRR